MAISLPTRTGLWHVRCLSCTVRPYYLYQAVLDSLVLCTIRLHCTEHYDTLARSTSSCGNFTGDSLHHRAVTEREAKLPTLFCRLLHMAGLQQRKRCHLRGGGAAAASYSNVPAAAYFPHLTTKRLLQCTGGCLHSVPGLAELLVLYCTGDCLHLVAD